MGNIVIGHLGGKKGQLGGKYGQLGEKHGQLGHLGDRYDSLNIECDQHIFSQVMTTQLTLLQSSAKAKINTKSARPSPMTMIMTQVLTCRQVGGLRRRGGDGPGQGGSLGGPSHNVLHKHGSANKRQWFLTRAIVLDHMPQINILLTKLFLLIVPIKKMPIKCKLHISSTDIFWLELDY